jgi:hypothetical protein
MALVNFTNLDFDQIKNSLIEYLRANSNFTDYDYEGSNLSTIIDLLAYNTYISSYNANMLSNEVFIDSATLRENVVSLASHIGYVPRSRTSAKANISFFVNTVGSTSKTLTLKKGTICSASYNVSNNRSYTFSIFSDVTVPVTNSVAFFKDINVYEGTYILERFVVDSATINQKYILSNPNIDTSTIRVQVRTSEESTLLSEYKLCSDLCTANSDSLIYFIKEIEDQRYELLFGDGVFGKKLDNKNIVEVYYLVSNGQQANGIGSFTFNGRIFDDRGRQVSNGISNITTNSGSQGGREIESIESIRKFAPRLYSSQKRAVTTQDYETIITSLYPETESISVFGGEKLNPPKYGKVFVAIKPYNGEFLSEVVKQNLTDLLRQYSVAGIIAEIIDLKYLYLEVDSSIYYNTNVSTSANDLLTKVNSNIERYADSSELNQYGTRFKYSKFVKIIDDSDRAVTSNITKITMRRDIRAVTDSFSEYEICFGNEFHINDTSGYNIKSSGFRIAGLNQDVYMTDVPDKDLLTGKIVFFKVDFQSFSPVIINNNAGKINYRTGEIIISPVNIISTAKIKLNQPVIEISATPQSNDVIGLQDLYLQLDIPNSNFRMISDAISSGSDISGSSYIVSSSYPTDNLIRGNTVITRSRITSSGTSQASTTTQTTVTGS